MLSMMFYYAVFVFLCTFQYSFQVQHWKCPLLDHTTEINQQKILEILLQEINVNDHKLGLVFRHQQLQLWYNETGMQKHDPSIEEINEEADVFYQKYSHWASTRFHQYCLQDSHYYCYLYKVCQYLADAGSEFSRYIPDLDNSHITQMPEPIPKISKLKQQTEDFNHLMVNKWIQDLRKQIQNIRITHQDKELVCEESLEQSMMKIRDPKKLKLIWIKCHKMLDSGSIPELFQLIRSKLGGANFQELWIHWNQDLGVESTRWILSKALVLWNQVKPFYRLLFDYMQHRLRINFLPNDPDYTNSSTIPIHWLRSLTATRLYTIIDLMKPYENLPEPSKNLSDPIRDPTDFYVKTGFEQLPDSFWRNSYIVSNKSCHPVAMDMILDNDARIKICLTNDTEYDSRRFFHELGHIYYYLLSGSRRNLYKLDQNSAVHESIGEVMRLLWNGCGLLEKVKEPRLLPQYRINALMEEALSSFMMIPFGISLELWRHRAFTNMINASMEELNRDYWSIRRRIQGFRQPIDSVEKKQISLQLDPLLKFHVSNFIPYLRYVFGTMVMHQFHEKICLRNYGNSFLVECCPRHRSDLYIFRKFLTIDLNAQEKSQKDLTVLQKLFDSDNVVYRMDSLLRYYQPLIDWLQQWKNKNFS